MALTEEEKKIRKKESMRRWRDSLTPEQIAERRKRQNERYHARRKAAAPKQDRQAFLEDKRQKKILADRAYRAKKRQEKDDRPPICEAGPSIQGTPAPAEDPAAPGVEIPTLKLFCMKCGFAMEITRPGAFVKE